ncbi:class I SAM-dependent methyltransferase [Amnibacterium flavum]|uniref:SAM-dependent methyltransferase n=1 Tax=Amnibacterium flavum TaxID=2173173 RepID=A0A2V1HLN8_9MICO|nr:methyltransferase domain-containing protein [Amnibacterium flavum]PVZ93458.1 SAM-dependent methyltransferase [Amnibacterium flavum]
MTIDMKRNGATEARVGTFGAGGAEPYASALAESSFPRVLTLRRRGHAAVGEVDIERWRADADETDISLLATSVGPVLDIGCGPGRMVRAAMAQGLSALGIDVSHAAVKLAAESGLTVLTRSVFEPLPREHGWETVLLLDGNLGIGGDVTSLLVRCRELLAPGGTIIVETNVDPDADTVEDYTLADEDGRESDPFPWAEVGVHALSYYIDKAGLTVDQVWEVDSRTFCRLRSR